MSRERKHIGISRRCQVDGEFTRYICLSEHELLNEDGGFREGTGFEIQIPGFQGNPSCPEDGQVWIEVYEGRLLVHVWNGQEDPVTVEIPRNTEEQDRRGRIEHGVFS